MASALGPCFEDGSGLDDVAGDEIVPADAKSQTGESDKGSKSKASAAGKRKKKGDVVMLSSSYTCWKKVPDTCFKVIGLRLSVACCCKPNQIETWYEQESKAIDSCYSRNI